MKVNFDNIDESVTDMENFKLKWRFTEQKYDVLPEQHLNQLKPLNEMASEFLWNHRMNTNIHGDYPFKKEFFRTIEKIKFDLGKEKEVKKWLFKRAIPFSERCFISWQPTDAMIAPWKIFVKYFDSFSYYGDELTIFDQNMNWSLLFAEDYIYFGTNKDYKIIESFEENNLD